MIAFAFGAGSVVEGDDESYRSPPSRDVKSFLGRMEKEDIDNFDNSLPGALLTKFLRTFDLGKEQCAASKFCETFVCFTEF